MNIRETQDLQSEQTSKRAQDKSIPITVQESLAAFHRDLSALLGSHFRQWVAYTKGKQIGVANSQQKMNEICRNLGYKRGEYVVCCVLPPLPADEDSTPAFDI